MLTLEEGTTLVKLARDTISARLEQRQPLIPDAARQLNAKQGVFVTLKKDEQLRGCIGYPEPTYPLFHAVMEAAKHASFDDPRFPPLQQDELQDILIEMSVLTVPQRLKVNNPDDYLKKIKIGRDGLIIRAGMFSGLLLPQVPTEYDWDVETFLRHLCMKAGLSYEAWQNPDHQISTFQAQIFTETHEGDVIEEKGDG